MGVHGRLPRWVPGGGRGCVPVALDRAIPARRRAHAPDGGPVSSSRHEPRSGGDTGCRGAWALPGAGRRPRVRLGRRFESWAGAAQEGWSYDRASDQRKLAGRHANGLPAKDACCVRGCRAVPRRAGSNPRWVRNRWEWRDRRVCGGRFMIEGMYVLPWRRPRARALVGLLAVGAGLWGARPVGLEWRFPCGCCRTTARRSCTVPAESVAQRFVRVRSGRHDWTIRVGTGAVNKCDATAK